jgi:hypothetical protein
MVVARSTPPTTAASAWRAHGPKLAFLAGALLTVLTAVLIVVAVASVLDELAVSPRDSIHLLSDTPPLPTGGASQAPADVYTLHVAVESLDEARGTARLRVFGLRACPTTCPDVAITLYSLGGSAAQRLGLPPKASLSAPPNTQEVTGTVELPVRGEPTLYPFDTTELVLGALALQTHPDGTLVPIVPHAGDPPAYLTLQSQVLGVVLAEPQPVAPASVRAAVDPASLLYVRALQFRRPLYSKVLTVLLVGLVAAAAAYSVCTQPVPQLFLGLGSLILGVWGIRGVLLAGGPPHVTAVDLLLSGVILVILAGLLVRVTAHFRQRRVSSPDE